jgi:hypothetical protein
MHCAHAEYGSETRESCLRLRVNTFHCIFSPLSFNFRDYFSKNGYECSVEFSKESDDDRLYIALKFDSRSVAKEVLNK